MWRVTSQSLIPISPLLLLSTRASAPNSNSQQPAALAQITNHKCPAAHMPTHSRPSFLQSIPAQHDLAVSIPPSLCGLSAAAL
ncbi:hypothetical protein QBC39DRAFT_16301 [Podospora conica]|nr:hypothetical protein QBC39DRAFT_16301 [Schizothecium conicum]